MSDDITAAQVGGRFVGEKFDQTFPPESCWSQQSHEMDLRGFILGLSGLGQPSVGPSEEVGAASTRPQLLTQSIGFGSRLVLREHHCDPAEPETRPRVDVSFWREALCCVGIIRTGSCFGVALKANGG